MQEILSPPDLPASPAHRLLAENGFTGNVFLLGAEDFDADQLDAALNSRGSLWFSYLLSCLSFTESRALSCEGIMTPVWYAEGIAGDQRYRMIFWVGFDGVILSTYIQEYTDEPFRDLRIFSTV